MFKIRWNVRNTTNFLIDAFFYMKIFLTKATYLEHTSSPYTIFN